jgi:hypothetical protein
MGISFIFERRDDEPPGGFELGDLVVTTATNGVSSKGRQPDAGMMIYLALVDLMNGISALARGDQRRYEFVGADSSFGLLFTRSKTGVAIKQGDQDLGTIDPLLLAGQLLADVDRFLADHPLPSTDSVFEGVTTAREQLHQIVAAGPAQI